MGSVPASTFARQASPLPCMERQQAPCGPGSETDACQVSPDMSSYAREVATQQQMNASEQVVGTMRDVAEVSKQSAASGQMAADGARRLTASAEELQSVVHRFVLD
ncbi:MAG: hypothetical protein HY331_00410 [Chloroflexi bacterium]|nr:hypothetical protein [Chloroflexota bacterium]